MDKRYWVSKWWCANVLVKTGVEVSEVPTIRLLTYLLSAEDL